jgi:hypothetical protein
MFQLGLFYERAEDLISQLIVINRTTDAKSAFGCDSDATRVV